MTYAKDFGRSDTAISDRKLLLRGIAWALVGIPVLFFLLPCFIVRCLPAIVR